MAVNIRINIIGDKQVIQKLNNIATRVEKPKEPLQNSSKIMMAAIMENFKSQGKTFQTPWPPLSPLTIKIKKELGYGSQPPLVRTKRMRSGFKSRISKNMLTIYNPVPYFREHQLGIGKKLPQRVMLKIDKARLNLIIDAFVNWINVIIKKK